MQFLPERVLAQAHKKNSIEVSVDTQKDNKNLIVQPLFDVADSQLVKDKKQRPQEDKPSQDPFRGAEPWELTEREESIVIALAKAAFPKTRILPGGGEETLSRLYRYMRGAPTEIRTVYRSLLWVAEYAPMLTKSRLFTQLTRDEGEQFLSDWCEGKIHLVRTVGRAVVTPLKYAHFDSPLIFKNLGIPYELPPLRNEETPRWLEQVIHGKDFEGDIGSPPIEFEAEVIVIGTGAGGAAAAYELARRGRAVLMLEEGEYHRRSAFTARITDMTKLLYREMGMMLALGNVNIPVFAGRTVGGSTVLSSGTCYRAPDYIFARWRERFGLNMFSADSMAPYYERVEQMLQKTPTARDVLGKSSLKIELGAQKLGLLQHHPLPRNAPDCDGQGVCCFGCPTGAKRSTDVSYVPEALKRGAQLVTSAKVTGFDVINGCVRGVHGVLGSGRRFYARASAVVVSAGALCTPLLMRRAGAGRYCSMLGENLSLHPATKIFALFDEKMELWQGVPQGYAVEDWAHEGLIIEGYAPPLDIATIGTPYTGQKLMKFVEQYPRLGAFGVLVQDTSRGSVREGVPGKPLITYNINADDHYKLQQGVARVCELFLAAGARKVLPFVMGMPEITSMREVRELATRKLSPGDIEITAYHPLGTCRIGTDPRHSVLGPDHQSHEIEGLYVMDGSAIPSSIGVNPQMTIMAMALRAAEMLNAKLN